MRMVIPHSTGRLLDELSSDVNKFFETFLGEDGPISKADHWPPMDFEERDDAYELAIDLPGMKSEDIHIDVENDHVSVHGTRHQLTQEHDERKRRIERSYGDFRRVIRLPKAFDKESVTASYEDGVLTVTLPKVAKDGPRRVEISHGGETS